MIGANVKLEKLRALRNQLNIKQDSFDSLQQQVLEISDGDMGTIPGKKIQFLTHSYSSTRKKANDQIRNLENLVHQYEIYQSSKSDLRKWTKDVVQRITDIEKTLAEVTSMEECQEVVAEIETILIEKQEGEVRVHVVLGKGKSESIFTSKAVICYRKIPNVALFTIDQNKHS